MGCITDIGLENITLDCNDIPTGGVKKVYIANACDTVIGVGDKPELANATANPNFGKVSILAFDNSEVFELEFNRKDGVTGWTEQKTVDNSGLVTNVPTFTIEFPKMTLSKRNMINDVLNPNVKVLLFIESAAGTYQVLGAKYGMSASEGSGDSGSGRTEKNAYTLTFTGEESELSYDVEDKWANVTGKVAPSLGGEGDWQNDTTEAYVPRQHCIPVPA